jgi:hypothetical protein
MRGRDESFLKFLCETIHPMVRKDTRECEKVQCIYNEHLESAGFEIFVERYISKHPVFSWRSFQETVIPGVSSIKKISQGNNSEYIVQQIRRIEASIDTDPELAIGTSKELVETWGLLSLGG